MKGKTLSASRGEKKDAGGRDAYRSGGAVTGIKGRGSANGGGMSPKSPMSSAGNMKGPGRS